MQSGHKRKIQETAMFQIVVGEVDHSQLFDDLLKEWGDSPYAPLAVLCATVIALGRIHQTHHWQSKGDSFYGDHLLFQRLYDDVLGEIDSIGERTIGLGSTDLVNPVIQQRQVSRLVQVFTAGSPLAIPRAEELVKGSQAAEMHFLRLMDLTRQNLSGVMSLGTDNLLAGICDKHEEHLYLLKQRLSNNVDM